MPDVFEIVHEDTSQISRQVWLQYRRTGLGSSDAAPALGLSPHMSAYELWCDKKAIMPDREETERMLWGRIHEPAILKECDRREWTSWPIRRHLMLRSVQYRWMIADPDGLSDFEVIEIKTADKFDQRRWDRGVPDHYVLQAHHLMIVTGRPRCFMPVLFGGNELLPYEIAYDDMLAQKVLAGEHRFWQMVEGDEAPDPDGSESAMHALRTRYSEAAEGKAVELPAEANQLLAVRAQTHQAIKEDTEIENECKAQFMAWLGEAEIGLLEGEIAVTWKPDKRGVRSMRFPERGDN